MMGLLDRSFSLFEALVLFLFSFLYGHFNSDERPVLDGVAVCAP